MVDKKQENWTKRMEALERMIHGDDITDETEDFLKKMKEFLDQNDPSTVMEAQYIAIRLATIGDNDPAGFRLIIDAALAITRRRYAIPTNTKGKGF